MLRSSASPGFWMTLRRHLNFFRIHLLFFTFTPLICSVVLYASNGRYPIAYIDALYMSVSAVTVCGLATINLSALTPWQQVLLFIQMCVGSPVVISWTMVYIRRHFFAKKFEYIIQAEAARHAASRARAQQPPDLASTATGRRTFAWPVTSLLRRRNGMSPIPEASTSDDGSFSPREKDINKKLRTDMIRRVDAPPKRVDPNGWVSQGIMTPLKRLSSRVGSSGGQEIGLTIEQTPFPAWTEPPINTTGSYPFGAQDARARAEETQIPLRVTVPLAENTRPPASGSVPQGPTNPLQSSPVSVAMPRTATIEFAPTVTRHCVPLSTVTSSQRSASIEERPRRQISRDNLYHRRYAGAGGPSQASLTLNPSQLTSLPIVDPELGQAQATQSGFGGFPMPHELLGMLFRNIFPRTANQLQRTTMIPATTTLTGGELGRIASISGDTGNVPSGSKPVSYISFDAIVGRNSAFHMLTNEQLEELGGVEYRGLNALLWLVALKQYHFGSQLISFIVIAPYMTLPKWASDFVPPALIRPVATPWFSLFQVVSSYTNTGFSLVDQSMIPFQTAYPMIFFMAFLILAGNTAFPIFLRFLIWTIAKFIPTRFRLSETLNFLLDHPRRCFVYLFPAHQTWFLMSIVLLLNSIDFFCFIVLDIGNPDIESIPLGTRFAAGVLQSADVRAAGFAIVPLAALAPAVKVMYVIMMYISVYPIAMSVRSTNVYEEQSLGIFRMRDQLSTAEQAFKTQGSRMATWGRYLAMHARYQLSFDMWWLALALFLVCIIERDNLINPEVQGWFNIFSILFEIVSAYGSVGLSLGIPTQNYSLSGAFRPLSKLIVCVVMIRGRHRGLPVAIDRAIVLPYEFEREYDNPDLPPDIDDRRSSQYSADAILDPVRGSTDDAEHGQTTRGEGPNRG